MNSRQWWSVLAFLLLLIGVIIITLHYLALVLIAPGLSSSSTMPLLNIIVHSNLAVLVAVCLLILSGVIFLRNA